MKMKCLHPFSFLEFHDKGNVYCCCPSWTSLGPVGNVYEQTIEEIWNGKKILRLRRALYKSDYKSYCRADYCPFMKNPMDILEAKKEGSKRVGEVVDNVLEKKVFMDKGPREISISHSGVCNLGCKMCLSYHKYVPYEPELGKKIFNEVIPKLLDDVELIRLTGNGDLFSQKEPLEFIQNFDAKSYPKIRFEILTNGQRFDEKIWKTIKHNNISSVDVSIDGASKETYKEIRRGGRWDVLQKNLKLLSKLRRQEKIGRFAINMTVMRTNYKEIEEFAKMGIKLGCDAVYYNKIFGKSNLEENIYEFKDPDVLIEINKILKRPIFSDPRINTSLISEYKKVRKGKLEKGKFRAKLSTYKAIYKVKKLSVDFVKD